MDRTSLGDRMKTYEGVWKHSLVRRMPAILRVDGRAFHSYTRGFDTPFDQTLHNTMVATATSLMQEIQGAKLAYGQSDEISILITDYDTLDTQAWFGGNIQKMVSIAASVSTNAFNRYMLTADKRAGNPMVKPLAQFDARIFNLPREEVANYFIWRQQDATRNSVQMVARANFSHRECQDKSCSDLQDMLMAEGTNWNDTPTHFKRGFCVLEKGKRVDRNIPIFTQQRDYIETFTQ